ncbi:GNAT family N-acetyltransferase [Clostridium polynesiense]|uniref:GNAT family N-acetyltransferase n=1 Tax=Clostridium polynesiense TaxID=1325933 RepID=UPI00058F9BDC|nr:GNAT family N-acetyltransferase [Clostridium polynesiense]
MNIYKMQESDFQEVLNLWNEERHNNRFLHKKFNKEAFINKFVSDESSLTKINYVYKENEKIVGFINGCYKNEGDTGYITFVLVKEEYLRRGIGSELVNKLEERFKSVESIKKMEITFFNPINLEWIVPGTADQDHPNAPGLDLSSPSYIFFKNMRFKDVVNQNSYYRLLDGFEYSSDIAEREKALHEKDIHITYYDKSKHYGFEELFRDLDNPLWEEAVMSNVEKGDSANPVLIVEHKGKICGFTGPLTVQESKRGYFAGIGIHSEYRKHGAGKVLFSALCKGLKDAGAEYMTLFTGDNNPARNIYESAGFKIVRSWAIMRKEFK